MPKIIKIQFGLTNYCKHKLVQCFDSQCTCVSREDVHFEVSLILLPFRVKSHKCSKRELNKPLNQ